MTNLNVFIDGSWLFKACAPERALANRMEFPDRVFPLDFNKLKNLLLTHAQKSDSECKSFGDLLFSTSIFSLPDDLDKWPEERDDVSQVDIDNVRRSAHAREKFTDKALDAGFSDSAIFHPRLKGWMLQKLRDNRFQEKQVDTTVVALLVKAAITKPDDVHAIITGDSDILPAIRVAYPEYSKNVFVATIHPDQLLAENRQTAFALADMDYTIDPLFLDQNVQNILHGENIYLCSHCNKAFLRPAPIPRLALPCCTHCHQKRT